MKGYFGIGVEGSKAMNVGTLFRTAHAFGASFVFTVRAQYNRREGSHSDTSDTPRSVPTYHFADLSTFRLPLGCRLVGVEISDDAIELPSFRHPRQAAYILAPSARGCRPSSGALRLFGQDPHSLLDQPGCGAALVMYDRLLTLVAAPRPLPRERPRGGTLPVFGEPIYKRKQRARSVARAKLQMKQ
jgi:hypothetical protein